MALVIPPRMGHLEPRTLRAALAGVLTIALLLAAALRGYRLDEQILMQDEWHGLLMIQDHGFGYLLTHFGGNDHCIPLTLWHGLLNQAVGIDELVTRLVPLCCGLELVVLVPFVLAPHVGTTVAGVLALLLAISPFLAFFSRFARPYGPALLLAHVAVLALHAWCRRPRPAMACTFAVAAALCVWFHPLFAPFLLGSWLATLRQHRTLRLGLGAAAAGALLLAPPLLVDFAALAGKAARTAPTVDTVDGALPLFFGVAPRALAGALLVAALRGIVRLHGVAPLLVRILTAGSALQVLAVTLSGADVLDAPGIWARYCLPVVPLLLLGLARTIADLAEWCRQRLALPRPLLVAAMIATLLAFGPWRTAYWFPNQWTNHEVFQSDYESRSDPLEQDLRPRGVSSAYSMLASLPPGSTTIVETPFPQDFVNNPFVLLQLHHRQRVVGGFAGDLVAGTIPALPRRAGKRDPRWTTSVTDVPALRARGVRWVIVHKDLHAEFPRLRFTHSTDSAPIERFLRDHVGPPVFEDEWVLGFELKP